MSRSEPIQDQLPLEDRPTILTPAPRKREGNDEEERYYESPYRRIRRIMKEGCEE